MLDPPQLPAGAVRWPPGVVQGAGQPPCGGLCSHGPGDSEGRADKDADSAGLGLPQYTPESNTAAFPAVFHVPLLTSRNPLHNHIPHTPRSMPHTFLQSTTIHILSGPHLGSLHCPCHCHSPQASPSPPLFSVTSHTIAHSNLGPHLHVDKGPQVSPRQLKQQLNQGRIGGLHSQMQNCLIALDLL